MARLRILPFRLGILPVRHPFRMRRLLRPRLPGRALLSAALSLVAAVVVARVLAAPTPPEPRPAAAIPAQLLVVDGDTVRADGALVRLVGFNAPEISSAACATERKLGVRAQQRLREIARTTSVSLQRVACACAPGTEGTSRCNYGRLCGVMTSNGVDVGTVLVGEGLAVPYFCGATHCPPKPRPWCR